MKRKFGRIAVILCVLVMLFALTSVSHAVEAVRYEGHAEVLKSLELFSGTNNGFELERAPKRVEVAAMLVKFLGAEEEAKAKHYAHPFTDVPEWADDLIGYMYEKGLTTGIGNNLFGVSNTASAKDYTVFLLKALGYDMTDFEYANTIAFAVKSALFTEKDRVDIEGRTFRRDEMVYLSYMALSAKVKGTELSLSQKLGKGEVPKVVVKPAPVVKPEATITVKRVQYLDDAKSAWYVIDKKTLPAEYSDFTYLGVGTVFWNFPTTSEIIYFGNPTATISGPFIIPYDLNSPTGFSLGKNTIVTLFDQNKKAIGFFDIMNNDKLGTFQVKLKPVTALKLSIPEVTTGLSTNSKGELVVNRGALPAAVKNYSKIAFAEYPAADPAGIFFNGKYAGSLSTTTFYTSSVIDVLSINKSIGNKLNVYFYDGSNNLLGYSLVDAKPIIAAMQKKLTEANIREIKSGLVAAPGNTFLIKSELDYPNPAALVYWSYGNISKDYNPVSLTYSNLNKTYGHLETISLNGAGGLNGKNANDIMYYCFYNKDKKIVAYALITNDMLNTRKDIIKNVDVFYKGEKASISNSDFTVQYYKGGKLVDTRTVALINLISDNVKGDGARLINVAIDPKENYEIKLISNTPLLKVTSFEIK